MVRQDSSYLHSSQAGLIAEIRINLSMKNLQGKGFALLMKILFSVQHSRTPDATRVEVSF